MKISIETPFLHAGENASRSLKAEADASLVSGREVRIAFVAPSGKLYLSPAVPMTDGEGTYLLPACLLDRYGRLCAQMVIYGDDDFCIKSEVFIFDVHPGIDETSAEAEDGELITLVGLDERLRAAEERLEGLSPITDEELAGILI